MKHVTAFIAGVLFAAGLLVSGMVVPSKVLGFLDFSGNWDPSLAFVMGGALLVYAPLYRLIVRRERPLNAPAFDLPTVHEVDHRLVLGAVIFGVGWGLVGLCPGPALVSAGALIGPSIAFVIAMSAGALSFRLLHSLEKAQPDEMDFEADA